MDERREGRRKVPKMTSGADSNPTRNVGLLANINFSSRSCSTTLSLSFYFPLIFVDFFPANRGRRQRRRRRRRFSITTSTKTRRFHHDDTKNDGFIATTDDDASSVRRGGGRVRHPDGHVRGPAGGRRRGVRYRRRQREASRRNGPDRILAGAKASKKLNTAHVHAYHRDQS